jgi:hypothetical protein
MNDLVVDAILNSFRDGKNLERGRVLMILEKLKSEFNGNDYAMRAIAVAMKRIETD